MHDEDRDHRVRDEAAVVDRADVQEMIARRQLGRGERSPGPKEIQSREGARVIEGEGVAEDLAAVGGRAGGPSEADRLPLENLERLSGRVLGPRGRRQGLDQNAAEYGQDRSGIPRADREVPYVPDELEILLGG